MTIQEKEALLKYLEFSLHNMIARAEHNLDPESTYILYEGVIDLLEDMDHTIDGVILSNLKTPLKKKNK